MSADAPSVISMRQSIERFQADGFSVLPQVYCDAECDQIVSDLTDALGRSGRLGAIRNATAGVYAARNLLTVWPATGTVWKKPALIATLTEILGAQFGLVRALFFDKPPAQTWALPWHKDMTVAVRNNQLPSKHFGKPTKKMG